MSDTENNENDNHMSRAELRSAGSLSLIFFLRMSGLFMLLPVLALYAEKLPGATPTLVGLALGAYGLTQALMQIPFGNLSDRFGRKPVITAGFLIFAIGSVVAAMSDTITGVIIGRALQGAGAVAAAVMALAADLTREEHRSKVMAIIGISIGFSFTLAFLLGPILNIWLGVPGLFWLAMAMSLVAIAVLYLLVPQPVHSGFHRECESVPAQILSVLKESKLLKLDAGIFILHITITASFLVVPGLLRDNLGLPTAQHWEVYVPVLILSILLMAPFLGMAERGGRMKLFFSGAVAILLIAQLAMAFAHETIWHLATGLLLYFAAFNFLEASLPSIISRTAPLDRRGTAMGVYTTSQFAGAFVGGLCGGWINGHWGATGVFLFTSSMALLWLLISLTMPQLKNLRSTMLRVGRLDPDQAAIMADELLQVPGVAEAVVIAGDGVAYLKVDSKRLDQQRLQEFSQEA